MSGELVSSEGQGKDPSRYLSLACRGLSPAVSARGCPALHTHPVPLSVLTLPLPMSTAAGLEEDRPNSLVLTWSPLWRTCLQRHSYSKELGIRTSTHAFEGHDIYMHYIYMHIYTHIHIHTNIVFTNRHTLLGLWHKWKATWYFIKWQNQRSGREVHYIPFGPFLCFQRVMCKLFQGPFVWRQLVQSV